MPPKVLSGRRETDPGHGASGRTSDPVKIPAATIGGETVPALTVPGVDIPAGRIPAQCAEVKPAPGGCLGEVVIPRVGIQPNMSVGLRERFAPAPVLVLGRIEAE
jgi:hypothetical protein